MFCAETLFNNKSKTKVRPAESIHCHCLTSALFLEHVLCSDKLKDKK